MKNIVITRQSTLFKLVAFLSQLPVFSMFIKRTWVDYNPDTFDYRETYSTFNDICTFCRHTIFAILTCFLYLFIFAIMVNYIVVQPIVYLLGGESMTGLVTVGIVSMLIGAYLILLVIQHIYDLLCMLPIKDKYQDERNDEPVEPSFFAKTFDILSQKHHNFCNRIQMKDKE